MTKIPVPAGAQVGVDTSTSARTHVAPSVDSRICTRGCSLIVNRPGPRAIGGNALADCASSRLKVDGTFDAVALGAVVSVGVGSAVVTGGSAAVFSPLDETS